MENIEFNFKNFDYLFFMELKEKQLNVGIIEVDKKEFKGISDREKELYISHIVDIDYEVLYKLETNVNPRSLVEIIKFINRATYLYCDTKQTKDFLFHNLNKNDYEIKLQFKIKI